MLLPVVTEFDADSNTLYAETDELGTYCVLDMEVVMRNFGIEPEGISTEVVIQQMYSAANLETNEKPKSDEYCVNFIIDVRKDALTLEQISSIKKAICEFAQEVFNSKITLRLITQEASSFSDKDYNVEENFMSFDSFEKTLNNIKISDKEGIFGNYCTITDSISAIVDSSDMNVNNFIFIIYDQKDAIFEQNIADELCQKAKNNGININTVSPLNTALSGFQAQLAQNTRGLTINDLDNFNYEVIYNHVYGKPLDEQEFNAVLISGYKPVKLKGRLNEFNGVNSDEDKLSDWDEVNVKYWIQQGLIKYDGNGDVELPTLKECVTFPEKAYVKEGFNRIPWYYVEQLWDEKVLPICSDPTNKDTDGDGYDDEQDLDRLTPFVNPIILLHGRIDNTYAAFGLSTDVCPIVDGSVKAHNNCFGSESTVNGMDYSSIETHIIIGDDTKFGTLGSYLVAEGYTANKNLFAFNYPNEDFAMNNAPKLSDYIGNIKLCVTGETKRPDEFIALESDIFATEDDKENNHARFVLIGHSNGGLVSRYYIENMDGYVNVDKLITIDTPHYGAEVFMLPYISKALLEQGIYLPNIIVPLDGELRPESSLFTGEKTNYFDYANSLFNNPLAYLAPPLLPAYKNYFDALYDNETLKYMEFNQSLKLNGNIGRNETEFKTKYYAIGGLMANEIRFYPIPIILPIDPKTGDMWLHVQTHDFPVCTFKNDLGNFALEGIQSEEEFYNLISSKINMLGIAAYGKHSGDGVVEISSQLGVQIKNGKVADFIKIKKSSLLVSANFDYWINYNDPDYDIPHRMLFHNAILRMELLQRSVLEYIND